MLSEWRLSYYSHQVAVPQSFVGEGGSGDVKPPSHAALLQLLLIWLSSTTNTTGSALLVLQVAQYWTVGNSNTSSYLLIAPGYVYTVPTFGWSRIMFCGWWTLLSSAMREYECQWFPSSLYTLVTLLISSSPSWLKYYPEPPRAPMPPETWDLLFLCGRPLWPEKYLLGGWPKHENYVYLSITPSRVRISLWA